MNEGNSIVTGAYNAIQSATKDGKWDNEPVRNAAPNANLINEYITPMQCITTALPSTNNLVYCIRAGKIDDAGLMSTVTVDQMVEFFLYVKEVNAMVADMRSLQTDSLVKVITCNGSSLSTTSKNANELYPSLIGRTLLLNLPTLMGALVRLFKPGFKQIDECFLDSDLASYIKRVLIHAEERHGVKNHHSSWSSTEDSVFLLRPTRDKESKIIAVFCPILKI